MPGSKGTSGPTLALGPCWEVAILDVGQVSQESLFSSLDKYLGDSTPCPSGDLNDTWVKTRLWTSTSASLEIDVC